MATIKEQLEAIDAAINAILTTGQRIKTPTAEVEHASLAELRSERARLEEKLALENGGGGSGGIVRGIFLG